MIDVRKLEAEWPHVATTATPEELEKLDELRDQHARGEDRGRYGHDLWGAIQRGWVRKSREAIREAIRCRLETVDRHPQITGIESAVVLTLDAWVQEAASHGVAADEIRRTLQRKLDAKDHFQIERVVERERPS